MLHSIHVFKIYIFLKQKKKGFFFFTFVVRYTFVSTIIWINTNLHTVDRSTSK